MKRANTTSGAALLLAMFTILISGCSEYFQPVRGGEEVRFSGEIKGSMCLTKATYGGDANRYNESAKTYEPIYWSEGDVIKIYCSGGSTSEIESSGVTTAPAKYQANYRISEVTEDKTKAKIELDTATTKIGLRWNDDESVTHNFYAVYPCFLSTGAQITSSYQNGIDGTAIYCNLADVQNTLSGALTSSNGNYTLAPDMKWMLMYAYASFTRSEFPEDDAVFLEFHPLTTAIQFTITNSTSSDLTIKKLQLLSDSQISGTFNIPNVKSLESDGFPGAIHTSNVEGKTVTQDFTSSNVTIASGKTFTFTFFLSPVADVNDLKFRITRSDNSTMTTRLGNTDGTYVKFARCKKHFVTGIMVPEGVQWTIDYEPSLTDWISDGGEDVTLN